MSDLRRAMGGARVTPWLVLGGALIWSAALVACPALRADLDPLTAHPEAYAQGPWAGVMRAGYVGIAVAAAGAGVLARRRAVAAALLAAFAVGVLLIGILPPTGGEISADVVFRVAQLAPLAFLPATAWISWRERRRPLLALAALAWALFLPLVIGEPALGGILNRAADLVMGAWLVAFAIPYRAPRRAVGSSG